MYEMGGGRFGPLVGLAGVTQNVMCLSFSHLQVTVFML